MNFFGMGPMELMVIMVIALIIFGPGKLPEIGASIGKGIRDFKAATSELTGEFEQTMREVGSAADEVRQSVTEVQQSALSAARLDQMETPATRPAHPLPAVTAGAAPTAGPAPSKDDPLADLMGFPPATHTVAPAENGDAPEKTAG